MRKIILSFIFVFLIADYTFNTDKCNSQWIKTSGPAGGEAFSLALSSFRVFVGTSGPNSLFYTDNNGLNWMMTSLKNRTVVSLLVDGSNIYAGTSFYGIYKSTNGGLNWAQTDLNNITVKCLLLVGANIYAGTEGDGIYKSNGGSSWTQTSLNNRSVYALTNSGTSIFAGTDLYIYKSTNNGLNWAVTSAQMTVKSLTVSGTNIYAGLTGGGGVKKSTDNGITWMQTGLINQAVYSLISSGITIFAGTGGNGFFISNNNGVNWAQRNEGMGNVTINALLIANSYIFAGTNGDSVWRREISEFIGIRKISSEIPDVFSLNQNYPNPFNPTTNIRFQIKETKFASIKVFDILGKEVSSLVNEKLQPGKYEVKFDASDLSSGIYIYTLKAGDFTETKKMILLK